MNRRIRTICSIAAVVCAVPFAVSNAHAVGNKDVDLVIKIVLDQVRGEWPMQQYEHLDGGIRYLIDNGMYFPNTKYKHATTFTAVGHAVIGTGAPAALHGLPGNDWADRVTGERVYCVEDDTVQALGSEQPPRSPKNLTATTAADEIKMAFAAKPKVWGVAVKDRGTILHAGNYADAAFWYDTSEGTFYTSTYYMDELPGWVEEWNAAGHADRYRGKQWELLHPRETYSVDPAHEHGFGIYGVEPGMPKAYTPPDEGRFYAGLRFNPGADELTLDFAREIIDNENLGQRNTTDVLALGLSNLDYIGHSYGIRSLEYEDHFRRVDRMLGEFFEHVDEKVGLNRTLIVVTSDHGSPDAPEYYADVLGVDAVRLRPDDFMAGANQRARDHYGIDDDLIFAFWNPMLYFDPEVIERHDIDREEAQLLIADYMREEEDGIAFAVARSYIERGWVPSVHPWPGVERAFHPGRSGDVIFIQDQFGYLYFDPEMFATMHGSPYAYDHIVPAFFAGPDIAGGELVDERIFVDQIAITMTQYLGAGAPSGTDVEPISQVLRDRPVGNRSLVPRNNGQ